MWIERRQKRISSLSKKALLDVGRPLWLGIPTRIGKIPFALGTVLWIPTIHPGDHHIDGITCGACDLLHIGHLNFLKRLRVLGDELIVGEGISNDQPPANIETSQRGSSWVAVTFSLVISATSTGTLAHVLRPRDQGHEPITLWDRGSSAARIHARRPCRPRTDPTTRFCRESNSHIAKQLSYHRPRTGAWPLASVGLIRPATPRSIPSRSRCY